MLKDGHDVFEGQKNRVKPEEKIEVKETTSI